MTIDKSWFVISGKKNELNELRGFADAHVRFVSELPEKFIAAYTKKGDVILDPFAGFGTTLLAARKLGRIGIGIEYDKKKVDWLRPQLSPPHQIIHASSLSISKLQLPKIDMVFGSPPFMRYFDKEAPLSNYTKRGNYAEYLRNMGKIYLQIKQITKKNAPIIIDIENTFDKNHPATPLAWDVGNEVSKHLHFERDFIQCYKGKLSEPWTKNNHGYCLLFRNR